MLRYEDLARDHRKKSLAYYVCPFWPMTVLIPSTGAGVGQKNSWALAIATVQLVSQHGGLCRRVHSVATLARMVLTVVSGAPETL